MHLILITVFWVTIIIFILQMKINVKRFNNLPKVAMDEKGWSHSRICVLNLLSLQPEEEMRAEGRAEKHQKEEGTEGPWEVQTWLEKNWSPKLRTNNVPVFYGW